MEAKEVNQLIERHKELFKERMEIEEKLKEHFKPIAIEAKNNKDVDKLVEIAETLPFMGFRAIIYKTIYEIENETQS